MPELTFAHFVWALTLGAVSAVSLPLGSLVGLKWRFDQRYIAAFAAFGAGALIAALSVELVAPTSMALTETAGTGSAGHALANFLAMIVGGVIGGVLFVLLDALVNQQGGYIRKMSTTLAHVAARRRAEVRRQLQGVLEVSPFDALPRGLAQTLAGMLNEENFRQNQVVIGPQEESSRAYIVLEGELGFEINGEEEDSAGPGTLVGLLMLLAPQLTSLGALRAKTDVKCLSLQREDLEHLRSLSPAFDQACRKLAGERVKRLEQHVITRLSKAIEWTRSAAGALRVGAEMPALAIRRVHGEQHGSPLAVWLGILLDGIPESFVIGAGLHLMLLAHPAIESLRFAQVIPYTLVAGLFLSNFPEALSSSANMQAVGLKSRKILLMWLALMATTSVGAGLGFLLAGVLGETWLVLAEGVAAGAMLTMIAAAMIPEAAAHGKPSAVGLSTLAGFLAAVMFKLLE